MDKEWVKFVRQWKKDNPPLDNNCYVCGICGRFVPSDEVTLDHIIPRSSAPSKRLDAVNIQPAHGYCNYQKGSRHLRPKVTADAYKFLKEISR